jgi:hypothetical protein
LLVDYVPNEVVAQAGLGELDHVVIAHGGLSECREAANREKKTHGYNSFTHTSP